LAHVFRGVDPYNPIDTNEVAGTFSSPPNPRNVTITGLNSATADAMALAFWATADDNTWGLQSSDWTNIGLAQYRNLQGSDSSISSAYKTIAIPGTSGNVINRQLTLGGDAGNRHILIIRKRQ
jgi:hypothetical protein